MLVAMNISYPGMRLGYFLPLLLSVLSTKLFSGQATLLDTQFFGSVLQQLNCRFLIPVVVENFLYP
jgi:hypothetical protein